MSDPSPRTKISEPSVSGGRVGGFFKKKSAGSLILLVFLAIYAFAQPRLNERYGWDLPGLGDSETVATHATPGTNVVPPDTRLSDIDSSSDEMFSDLSPPTADKAKSTSRPATQGLERAGSPRSSTAPSKGPGRAAEPRGPPTVDQTDRSTSTSAANKPESQEKLKFGLLREIQPDRYISPEGLLYTPGSAEGHRLEHLRRHTKDIPSRPGSHGVFDGGMTGALKTVDRAYERAKKNQRTTKFKDDGRTIYTVDMGGRVGYVGGQSGNQRRKPMARRVKLILEGNRVITAYPL